MIRKVSGAVVGMTILIFGIVSIFEGNYMDAIQCIALSTILANQE